MEKCKVMDSKMRPLWVVFQNQDTLGDDIQQIFKNGDGESINFQLIDPPNVDQCLLRLVD